MDCALITSDILHLDSLPYPSVLTIVSQCPEVCREVFGIGDVDLTGIGVITANCIQLSLALVFFLFLFTDSILMPTIRQNHVTTTITIWLQGHHQTGLWSSLIFSLTLCLAGFIRQISGQITTIYENIAAFDSVCITYISLVLTTVCCYEKIRRPRLFAICFVATTIWAISTLILSIVNIKEEKVVWACWTYALKSNSPWKDKSSDNGRHQSLVQTTISIIFTIMLLSTWLALRWYRHQEHRKPSILRILVISIIVFSAFAAYNATERLYQVLLVRYGMDILWQGETGYNKWGVGQIGAPFAWAPLLIDMVYDGFNRIRNWWHPIRRDRMWFRTVTGTRVLLLQRFNCQ